jgi:hypothetical protein
MARRKRSTRAQKRAKKKSVNKVVHQLRRVSYKLKCKRSDIDKVLARVCKFVKKHGKKHGIIASTIRQYESENPKVRIPPSTVGRLIRQGYNGTTKPAPPVGRPTKLDRNLELELARQVPPQIDNARVLNFDILYKYIFSMFCVDFPVSNSEFASLQSIVDMAVSGCLLVECRPSLDRPDSAN